MSNELKAQARKTLIAQTSEALYGKLLAGKLMGTSKEVAIEILEERKAKGKFNGDLSKVTDKKASPAKNEKPAEKPAEKPVEGKAKAPATKKEAKPKAEKEPKQYADFPNFKPKFKAGQKVKFTPFRETKSIKGVVLSSYPYQPKKSDQFREDVRIKAGDKTYVKKGEDVEIIED